VTSVISMFVVPLCASPCFAQAQVTSLEELRRQLAAGDFITVVPTVGPPVSGRLLRVGPGDVDVRPAGKGTRQERGPRDVTIPLDAIQSLERPRDSPRNGAFIGAGIGAGFVGIMFVRAIVVDRNEIDEWAPLYGGTAAVCAGLGALIGWALDGATSKPHIRYDAASARTPTVRVQPVYSRGRGIALVVSFSR